MNEDQRKGFVNRHGHRADLNSIDLSDVSVENDGALPHASEPTAEQSKPKPVRRKPKFKWNKRLTLIIVGILALLVIIPVLAGEVLAASYRAGADGAHGKLEKLVKDKALPSQKQATIKSGTIGEMAAAVDDIRSSMCAGGLNDNLASLYPRAKSAHEDCIRKAGQVSDLSTRLKKLESQARYVESILNAAKTVTTPTAEPFAVISAQQANWQESRDAVNKLSAPGEWQKQHIALKNLFTAVANSWSVLNTASNAQDKAAFETAEKTLSGAYEGIRNTTGELKTTLHATQSDITAAYRKIQ